MQLKDTIQNGLPLTLQHHTRLAAIDAHDFTGVIRKVREEHAVRGIERSEAWYERGILALKQYYAIALLDGKNMHAVSNRLDPFWHAHILHTKDYFRFCDEVVGGYMHHDPLDHGIQDDVAHVSFLYEFTQQRYQEVFSVIDEEFNPRTLLAAELVCTHFNDEDEYRTAGEALFSLDPRAQPRTLHH